MSIDETMNEIKRNWNVALQEDVRDGNMIMMSPLLIVESHSDLPGTAAEFESGA